MGWSVTEVKRVSVWEFFSAYNGYVDANTPKQANKLTEDDKDHIWARMQELEVPSSTVLSTETYRLKGEHLVPAGVVCFLSD